MVEDQTCEKKRVRDINYAGKEAYQLRTDVTCKCERYECIGGFNLCKK